MLPAVISFNAFFPVEYRNGFRKPIVDWPEAIRRSLRSATMLAKTGVLALVPDTGVTVPLITTWYEMPAAETSGYARPVLLNRPALVEPRVVRYDDTASDWYCGVGKKFEKPPDDRSAAVSGAVP